MFLAPVTGGRWKLWSSESREQQVRFDASREHGPLKPFERKQQYRTNSLLRAGMSHAEL